MTISKTLQLQTISMPFKNQFDTADNYPSLYGTARDCKYMKEVVSELYTWIECCLNVENGMFSAKRTPDDGLVVTTPVGDATARPVFFTDENGLLARIIFVAQLDPIDQDSQTAVFAITVRERYEVTSGYGGKARVWSPGRAQQPWAPSEAEALGFDILNGQLKAASQFI